MDFSQTIGLSMIGNEDFATDQQIAVLDASVVHKTGGLAESIDGNKTFTNDFNVTSGFTNLISATATTTSIDNPSVIQLSCNGNQKLFANSSELYLDGTPIFLNNGVIQIDPTTATLNGDMYIVGNLVAGATSISPTELSRLDGVTSNIQTQINSKATDSLVVHLAGTETITGAKTFNNNITVSGTLINQLTSNKTTTGAGNYLYCSNSANNTLETSSGQNILTSNRATAAANHLKAIIAGGGNTLEVTSGQNLIKCGTGTNLMSATSGSNTIQSSSGNNVLDAVTGRNFLQSSNTTNFANTIICVSATGGNYLETIGGDNTCISSTGDNFFDTTSGSNILSINNSTKIQTTSSVNTLSNATNEIDGTTETKINMTSLTPLNVGAQITNTSFINTSNTLATSTAAYHRVANGTLTSGQPYFECFKGTSGLAGTGTRLKTSLIQYFTLSSLGAETSYTIMNWSSTATTITNNDVGIVGNVYCNKNYNVGTIASSIPLCTYMAFGTKLMGITTGTNQNTTMNGANWNGAFVNNFTRLGVNVVPYAYEFMMDSGTYTGTLSLMSMTVEVINGSSGSAVSGAATFNVSTTSGVGQTTNGVLTSPLTIVASALMGIRFRFTLTTGTLTANTAGITIRILCYQV